MQTMGKRQFYQQTKELNNYQIQFSYFHLGPYPNNHTNIMNFNSFIQDYMNFNPPSQSFKPSYQQKPQILTSQYEQKPQPNEDGQSSEPENQKNVDNISASNVSDSKKQSSIMAGKKARQKKKVYVESLEKRVNDMEKQVIRYDEDIKKTKQTLSKVLQSAKYNQNSLTYGQIQSCIQSEDPNQDRINLLLDMIRFRVGGCGNERQAKVEYFIKQLVNTLFPPFQRYLMHCCEKNLDIFQQPSIDDLLDISITASSQESNLGWTKQFLESLNLTEHQKSQLLKLRQSFKVKRKELVDVIKQIHDRKDEIKEQGKGYQKMISQIRSTLRPVQGAVWVLFSDSIRYKREIFMESQKELYSSLVPIYMAPHKKVKLN